ncbi:hypothetical protein [Sediminibacterium sp.]|uniref:hypothetical protein n=1 Tax=Sediminibacterium sp. TaxID=1917865 RepID=UPI003F7182A4
MKKICSFLLIIGLHLGVQAQEVNLKNFEKSYIAQDYKNPFKKAKKICFLGVNLGIRTQSFTTKNQKGTNTLHTYLGNLTMDVGYELADLFRKKLETKFAQLGYTIVDPNSLTENNLYQKLIENSTKKQDEEFFSKDFGVAIRTFPSGKRPVFKFPKFAGGAHARLANQEDMVVVNISPVLEPYFINWDRKYKYTTEYTDNFDFDPIMRFTTYANPFWYDVPNQIAGPDYGYINFELYVGKDADKLIYSKTNDYIVDLTNGILNNGKLQQNVLGKNTYSYGINLDVPKFKEAASIALDAYVAHLAAYAEDRRK